MCQSLLALSNRGDLRFSRLWGWCCCSGICSLDNVSENHLRHWRWVFLQNIGNFRRVPTATNPRSAVPFSDFRIINSLRLFHVPAIQFVCLTGKGVSIWDTYVHGTPWVVDGSTGDVAADSYRLYKQDVAALKQLGVSMVLLEKLVVAHSTNLKRVRYRFLARPRWIQSAFPRSILILSSHPHFEHRSVPDTILCAFLVYHAC